jgi:hypothetical protein
MTPAQRQEILHHLQLAKKAFVNVDMAWLEKQAKFYVLDAIDFLEQEEKF